MFDLASKNTGVCVWDIKKQKPYLTTKIKVTGKIELFTAELYESVIKLFSTLQEKHNINMSKVLVVKEAMPTQLRGANSTIQTFVAIAKCHAILDTLLYFNGINTYDYVGIYPITWHNYFRKINCIDKEIKITKELVHDFIVRDYSLSGDISNDETDAVFMCKTFVEHKWNNDICEEVREIKRHRKTLKADHAIKACDEKIRELENLKFNSEVLLCVNMQKVMGL